MYCLAAAVFQTEYKVYAVSDHGAILTITSDGKGKIEQITPANDVQVTVAELTDQGIVLGFADGKAIRASFDGEIKEEI
jgi:hypothetical protein